MAPCPPGPKGNRVYFGYGTGASGIVQIVDRQKLLTGPKEPTEANLTLSADRPDRSPAGHGRAHGVSAARHAADRVRPPEAPPGTAAAAGVDHDHDEAAPERTQARRDFIAAVGETTANECLENRQMVRVLDITTEPKPFGVSSWTVPESSGNFCERGGRFGTHSSNENLTPIYYNRVLFVAHFNAGVRAIDVRDPLQPKEIGYYIPAVTDKTDKRCVGTGADQRCKTAIQTNNVEVDDRGYIYIVDRANTGMHILQLSGAARQVGEIRWDEAGDWGLGAGRGCGARCWMTTARSRRYNADRVTDRDPNHADGSCISVLIRRRAPRDPRPRASQPGPAASKERHHTMAHRHTRLVVVLATGVLAICSPIALRSEDGRQPAAKEWAAVNGDLSNTRYSTLTQINPQTVGKLAGAWTSAPFDAMGSRTGDAGGQGRPAVHHRRVACQCLQRENRRDGVESRDRHAGGRCAAQRGQPDPSGVPSREGIAVGDGLVFVGLSSSRVIALREKTGEVAWDVFVGIEPARAGQGVSGAPVYANGMVFVGTAGDTGFRGKVVALEAQDRAQGVGVVRRRRSGRPRVQRRGRRTPTRGRPAAARSGWSARRIPNWASVYFGTGNGVPQYAGDTRAGDNLYLCSVVALEIKTGKLRWHYQTIRHDIWEADIAESPVLFDAQIGGRARKAIAAMRTDGYLFMLDRETGKPLMQIEERKVPQDARSHTVATQPYPVGADPVLPDCGEWRKQPMPSGFELGCFFAPASLDTPNLLTPAWGMRVVPMAFSPQTGYFYAIGNASLQWFRRAEDPYIFILGAGKVPGLPQGHARHGGDRQPHEQDRVEEGVSRRAARRCAGHRRRPAVPDDAGWESGREGRQNRRAACGSSRPARRAADRPLPTRSTASSTSRSA